MDIDSLFKVPKIPKSGMKRRLPDNPTPEMLKRMKRDSPPTTSSSSQMKSPDKGNSRAVTITDVTDEDDQVDEDFAPGGDADYFAEEDEEGRFFGGGLTDEQKQIMNIFDSAGGEGVLEDLEELSITGIRRLLLKFERAANKNQDHRSKYPNDPSKFIDSEADLDAAIKALLPLAQVPVLGYPELVKSGTVARLVGLLSHENVDIVIDVVEVIHELTDEEVGDEADDDDDGEEGGKEHSLKLLIEGLLENQILELLVQNLSRFNEEEESDRQGLFHVLGIFENILGFNPSLSQRLVSRTTILPWLLNRIMAKDHDENRGYASEVLSILLQDNRETRLELRRKDGVETLLKVIAQYRRRDPKDADEAEFMDNVFDSLCSALAEPEIKKSFFDSEGVDLMVLLMKEKAQARSRSIKVLDYALSTPAGTANCETFVEALGLKVLFSSLMGKQTKKQKTVGPLETSPEETGHILGILSSLFSNLASETPPRIRLLAKFVEQEYEKVDKLIELREGAETRLKVVEQDIAMEKNGLIRENAEIGQEEEAAWYLRRLDGGLFTLQTVDYILAWVCMEDDGVRDHVQLLLDRKDRSMKDIVKILKIFHGNVDEEIPVEIDGAIEDSPSQKMILEGLITFLEGCC